MGNEPERHASHLIWAPEVHRYFGEVCVFRLISTSDARLAPTLFSRVGAVAENAGISSYCSYSVFGLHDAFVRMWATDEAHLAFLSGLEASAEIDDLREFRIDRIHYSFQETHPLENEIADRDTQAIIARVARQLRQNEELLLQDRERLLKSGILLEVPAATGLKTYLLLQARNLRMNLGELEFDAVRRAVSNVGLEAVSIYRCTTHWANFLVKGVAPNGFNSLREVSAKIVSDLATLSMKTWTLPIPPAEGIHEFDGLDAAEAPEMMTQRRFISRMIEHQLPDARRRFFDLDLGARERLLRIFTEFDDKLERGPAETYFEAFFEANLLKDEVLLATSLSFMTQIEPLLRRLIPPMLNETLGADWESLMKAEFERRSNQAADKDESEIAPGSPRSKQFWLQEMQNWTLANLTGYLQIAGKMEPEVEKRIDNELFFPGWRTNIRTLIKARNDHAHGTIESEIINFAIDTDVWENNVRAVFTAAQYYSSLRRSYMKGDRS